MCVHTHTHAVTPVVELFDIETILKTLEYLLIFSYSPYLIPSYYCVLTNEDFLLESNNLASI